MPEKDRFVNFSKKKIHEYEKHFNYNHSNNVLQDRSKLSYPIISFNQIKMYQNISSIYFSSYDCTNHGDIEPL